MLVLKKKKNIIYRFALLFSLLLFAGHLDAQHGWTINVSDFEFSGEIVATVEINFVEVTTGTLGAFVGDECRGYVNAVYFPPSDHYVFQMLIYSNLAAGETLSFRYYDPGTGLTHDVLESMEFSSNMREGDAMSPLTFNVHTNEPPSLDLPIADQSFDEYFSSHTIDLSNVFSDADVLDDLYFSASSSNTDVVTVSISGDILTITEVGLGTSTITVIADDLEETTEDVFDVVVNNVNDAPVVVNALSDIDLDEHFSATSISIANVFSDKDEDPLSLSAVSGSPGVITVTVSGTDLIITEAGLGTSTITVTANDGELSASDQFDITVNNVNDAPVVSSPISDVEYDEGFGSGTISLGSVFSDPDGDALALSVASSNTSVVTVSLSGSTLTISEAGLGNSTITVTATDGSLSGEEQFLVTVNNVNDAPIVQNPIGDREDDEYFASYDINLASVFYDQDIGDNLTYTAFSNNTDVVTVSVSGSILTIAEQGLGVSTITVTATDDGDGTLSVQDDFTFTVNNVNDAPQVDNPLSDVVIDEHFTTTSVSLTGVFSDKDGDALSLSAVSSNNGVVTVSITGLDLIITERGLGSSTITVTASDGSLSMDEQFQVTVENVNDAPEIANQISDLDLDEHFASQIINVSNVFTDPDGDPLIISATSNNTSVVTAFVSGTNLVIAEAGLGNAIITVTASDGTLSVSDQLNVTVTNVNDAPEVTTPISSMSFNEGFGSTLVDLSPVFTDPDGDGMTYSAVSSNTTVVTVSVSGTTLTINEVANGNSTITVTASDGSLFTDDQFTFTINNINDYPEVVSAILDRNYDEGFSSENINLTTVFSDPDGDVLSYSAVSSNTSVVTVNITGSTLTISEVGLGSASITVTATDDGTGNLSIDDVFSVNVNNVNDPPVLETPISDMQVDEYFSSTTIDLTGTFSDPDGDDLTITAVSSNTGVIGVSVSGFILTISEGALGNSTITVTASDGSATAEDKFVVTINNVNDQPEVVAPITDRSPDEGFGTLSISLAPVFNDPDGDVLTLSAVSSNTSVAEVSVSSSTLTILEAGLGTTTITVTASDGSLSISDEFTVTVNNVNDSPVLNNPVADQVVNEYFESFTLDLSSTFSDPDGDELSITAASSSNSVVSVAVSGTILTVTEEGTGIAQITLTASDGSLNVYDQFLVTVNNINDAPVVQNEVSNQSQDEYFGSTFISISSVFSDADGDDLTITASSSATNVVTVSVSGTILTITEVGLGSSTITLTASDGTLSVDEQFLFTVNNVNDAPVVDNSVVDQTYEEYFGSVTMDLSSTFSDPDGNALTISAHSSNTSVISVGVSGTTLTIYEEGLGSAYVVLTASDGSLTVDEVFQVTVDNVNDAPTVANPLSNLSLSEYFGTQSINLTGVFSDVDGDQLSYTASSSNTSVATVSITGSILTITEHGLGNTNITVTATDDGEGTLSVSDLFILTVYNVNDAPQLINPIPDQSLAEYFVSSSIDLSLTFSDADNDPLTLDVSSSNTGTVTVSLSGTTLIITEVGLGSSVITVTASDGTLSATDQFNVVVGNVNDAPVIVSSLIDRTLSEGFGTETINLAPSFTDPDGDVLIFSASTSNSSVVGVTVSGSILTISEIGLGASNITVTASDGTLSVDDIFVVVVNNVNDAPLVAQAIADQTEDEYFTSVDLDLSGTFSDPDGDELTLSAVSSNTNVVQVSVSGTTLTVNETGIGVATINVSAFDGSLSVSDQFYFTVENVNDTPVVTSPVADQSLDEYFGTHTINISNVFDDKDDDILTVNASSSNTDVVNVSISGSTLSIVEVGLGSAIITLSASDGSLSVSDEFSVVVNNVNDAPVVSNPVPDQDYNEYFASATLDLSAVFNDKDGDELSLSAVSANTSVVTVSITGTTLTITEVSLGTTNITITASDGGLLAEDQFAVNVLNVNDAPVVVTSVGDRVFDEKFLSRSINLAPVFNDKDGDVLTYSAVSNNEDVVSVSVNASTLTIVEEGLGTSQITVTASDGELSVDDIFTITVNNVNDPPVVNNAIANQVANEYFGSVVLDLSNTFSDPDGDALQLSAVVTNEEIVTTSINGTSLTIYEEGIGNTIITVTADDGELTVNDQFSFTVNNVNDAPVVQNPIPNVELSEYFASHAVSLSGVFYDQDNNTLTYTANSSNTNVVTVSIDGNQLNISEVGLGSAVITVRASDGSLYTEDQFFVNVINVNDQPVIDIPFVDQEVNEYFVQIGLNLSNNFSDPDGDALTYSAISSNESVVDVSIVGSQLTIYETGIGNAIITVSASDGALSVNDQFSITVVNVNDPPVVNLPVDDFTLVEYFGISYKNLSGVFYDKDGNALSLSASSSNTGVVTVSIAGSILVINEAGLGTTTITVTATDGELSVDEVFDIEVINLNDAPVVANPYQDIEIDEHFTTVTYDLSQVFDDQDGDDLTLSTVSSNQSVVTTSVSGNILTVTEVGLGISTITVSASDGSLSVSDQFTITINNVNDTPVVISPVSDRNYDERFASATISLASVFSDPDGDPLSLSVQSSNTDVVNASISGTTLTLSEAGLGSSLITITASDGSLSVTDDFQVNVLNINDQPVVDNPLAPQEYYEYFGSVDIDLTDVFRDPDNDNLTLTAVSSNTSVVDVSITGTVLTITETGLGVAEITVTATDDGAGARSVTDIFQVTVNNVNDAPVLEQPFTSQLVDEHFGFVTIDLTDRFSDKDGDDLVVTAVSGNTDVVTVSIIGSDLIITEVGLGNSTITVSASDGALTTNGQFVFTVDNVNDAPIVSVPISDRESDEGFNTTTVGLASVFSDPDNDALTLTAVSSSTGVATVSITGTILTIWEQGLGDTEITVTASDGTFSVSESFSFTINNVNDQPVLDNPLADRNLNEYFGTLNINLANVFSDPDAMDVLTLSASSSNSGVVSVSVSGTILTITEEQDLGSAVITVRATDNGEGNLFIEDEFTVNVNNINDAPVVVNPIVKVELDEHFGTHSVDMSDVFIDPDGDDLVLTALSSNTGVVSVVIENNTLTIITEEGLGFSTVTVTATDGSLSVDDQFIVEVKNVNDPPVLDQSLPDIILPEHFANSIISLIPVFSDPDGDPLILTASSSDENVVRVTISGTNLVLWEEDLGSAEITVTASDGTYSNADGFIVTVSNENDAPEVVAPLSSISTSEGFGSTTIDLSPVFEDPDGDALSYSAISSNTNVVTVSISGTTLTISEIGNGSSTITITASDGSLNVNDVFTFAIDNVNDEPEIVEPVGDRTYGEGFTSSSINLATKYSDPDGDVITLAVSSSNTAVVTASIVGTTLTLTEIGQGNSTVTVTISDGQLSVDDVFIVSVSSVNDAPQVLSPVLDISPYEYFGTTSIDLSGVFTDPDGDDLTLSAVSSNNTVVTVSISGNNTLVIHEQGLGSSIITITADDGFLTASDQFQVSVINVNDAPEVINILSNLVFDEGYSSSSLTLAPVFIDPDGDELTLSALSLDMDVVTVDVVGSTLTITEVGLGVTTIMVIASDGNLSTNFNFLVTVNNVNDAPEVANPVSDKVLNEHFTTITYDLSGVFTDVDNDALTISAVNSNSEVVDVSVSGTDLIVNEVGLGVSTITLTVIDDGEGNLSVQDEFTISVLNVNDPPEVANPIADVDVDEYFGTEVIDLSEVFSDPDADILSMEAVSSDPQVVAVTIEGTDLIISEVGLGTASITITASDGSLSIDESIVVTVNNVNDAPVVANPILDVSVDEYFGMYAIELASVFTDKDDDEITFSVSSADGSVVSASLNGTTITLIEEGLGSTVVTVTASDGIVSVDDQFNVQVNNVNDQPVLVNPVADRNLNEYFGTEIIELSQVFTDQDEGTVLQLSAVSENEEVATVSVTGTVLTITEQGLGTTGITITASDGILSVDDSFVLLVENVNDAPSVVNPISNQVVNEYFSSWEISLDGVFTDKDGDEVSLSVISSNTSVVSITLDGDILTLYEEGLGVSTITITATDGSLSYDYPFTVTVNNVNDAPVVAQRIDDVEYQEHFNSTTLELSGVFSDKDGDPLVLSATSSNENVATVSITGTTLTIFEVDPGVTAITVTAYDGDLRGADQFRLTIHNVEDPPEIMNHVGDRNFNEFFVSRTIDISNVFIEPDGQEMTYTAESSDTAVVSVEMNGTDLIVIEKEKLGTSTITLTAFDGTFSTPEVFTVTVDNVNEAPFISKQVNDIYVDEYFSSITISLDTVFSDPDGDVLSFVAGSDDNMVALTEIDSITLILTEVAPGSAIITVTASDGELTRQMQFVLVVNNVNDAPYLVNPVDDITIKQYYEPIQIDISDVFADKDNNPLTLSAKTVQRDIVDVEVTGTTLIISDVSFGEADIQISATDGEYTAYDSLHITVIEDIPLIIIYDDTQVYHEDTILRCNDASSFDLRVRTTLDWSSMSGASSWLLLEEKNDSTITIAYSENVSGADRYGMITIVDDQLHKANLVIRQSSQCTGMEENSWNGSIFLYPNPVDDHVWIELNGVNQEKMILEMIDYTGKLLRQESINTMYKDKIELELSDLKPGVYIIKISDTHGRYFLDRVVKK